MRKVDSIGEGEEEDDDEESKRRKKYRQVHKRATFSFKSLCQRPFCHVEKKKAKAVAVMD